LRVEMEGEEIPRGEDRERVSGRGGEREGGRER
jgi:hypothetical protein